MEKDLTVDHIVPRSRGGRHEWTNVITSCKACNHRKGNKSLQEARMVLANEPYEPRPGMYYTIERRLDLTRQLDWHDYLPGIELSSPSSDPSSTSPAAD